MRRGDVGLADVLALVQGPAGLDWAAAAALCGIAMDGSLLEPPRAEVSEIPPQSQAEGQARTDASSIDPISNSEGDLAFQPKSAAPAPWRTLVLDRMTVHDSAEDSTRWAFEREVDAASLVDAATDGSGILGLRDQQASLSEWARLWPVVHRALGAWLPGHKVNERLVVDTLARGTWLRQIPREHRRIWPDPLTIVIDRSERLTPYARDVEGFVSRLVQLLGQTQVACWDVRALTLQGLQVEASPWHPGYAGLHHQQMLSVHRGDHLLLFSDLGAVDDPPSRVAWQASLADWRAQGASVMVVQPALASAVTANHEHASDNSLSLMVWQDAGLSDSAVSDGEYEQQCAREILAWLSVCLKFNPGMVRALRMMMRQFLGRDIPVSVESLVWNHAAVVRDGRDAAVLDPAQLAVFQQALRRIGAGLQPDGAEGAGRQDLVDDGLKARSLLALDLIEALLLGYPKSMQWLARDLMLRLVPAWKPEHRMSQAASSVDDDWLEHAFGESARTCALLSRLDKISSGDLSRRESGIDHNVARREVDEWLASLVVSLKPIRGSGSGHRHRVLMWCKWQVQRYGGIGAVDAGGLQPLRSLAGAVVNIDPQSLNTSAMPFWRDQDALPLIGASSLPMTLSWSPDSQHFVFQSERASTPGGFDVLLNVPFDAPQSGQNAPALMLRVKAIVPGEGEQTWVQQIRWRPDAQFIRLPYALPTVVSVQVTAPGVTLECSGLTRPWWATALHQTRAGELFAVTPPWRGEARQLRWRHASIQSSGGWEQLPDMGVDDYGLWAEFSVGRVTQRCRWIPAGTFWMGSPELEPGRYDDETQHQVTLTEGFWLADTACTQALWRVVMGSNPSHFQGKEAGTSQAEEHPVERVSWDDIACGFHGSKATKTPSFLQKLNDLVPGLNAGLPSEAHWEWACRADPSGVKASKPYHWGDDISTALANFYGQLDSDVDAPNLSKPLGRTTSVKDYQPNAWGLHQMHGNVWEWCRDWRESYEDRPQVDPEGPPSGSARVLRGGSWIDYARFLRSADRGGYRPAYRDFNIGFRLAPGQASSGRQAAEPPSASERGRGTRTKPLTDPPQHAAEDGALGGPAGTPKAARKAAAKKLKK